MASDELKRAAELFVQNNAKLVERLRQLKARLDETNRNSQKPSDDDDDDDAPRCVC